MSGRAGDDTRQVTYRTLRPGEEAEVVKLLNVAYRQPWGSEERWWAKHGNRPGFRREEIYIAEVEGRVVGCLHTAVRPIRLGPGIAVDQSFDGDLAVHPDYRGLKIPEDIYRYSTDVLRERGVELRGGYANLPLWTHFYRPRIGYVSGFDRTRAFKKELSAASVRDRLLRVLGKSSAGPAAASADPGAGPAVASADPGAGPALVLRIRDLEPLRFRLDPDGAVPLEAGAAAGGRTLTLHADQRIFGLLGGRGGRISLLLRLVLSGSIRAEGLFTAGPAVARWVLKRRGAGAARRS